MINPFDQNNGSSSYFNLQKRIFQHVQSSGINNQIIETVHKSYEDALNAENIVLSRPERKRLQSQILRLVLEDVLKKLRDNSLSG